jgi:hypothetical protein
MGQLRRLFFRNPLPEIISVESELKKAGVLRIILGLVVFSRFYQVVSSANIFHNYYSPTGICCLFLAAAFTIGFFTPFTTALLILSIRFFDIHFNTYTLGSSILIFTLITFLLTNSGQYYSVDGFFLRKKNAVNKLLKLMYGIIGTHNKSSLKNVYFFAFCCYGFISLGAILIHFNDEFWMSGLTAKSLFSNSYLCSQFAVFRSMENSFPFFVSLASIFSSIGQTVFQVFMLFFIFFYWGRIFVFWWGLFFLYYLSFLLTFHICHILNWFYGILFLFQLVKKIKNKVLFLNYY